MKKAKTTKKRGALLCALCAALVLTVAIPFTAFAGETDVTSPSDLSPTDTTNTTNSTENSNTSSSSAITSDSDLTDEFVVSVEKSSDLVIVDADGNEVDTDDVYYAVLTVNSTLKAQILKAIGATEENAVVYDISLRDAYGNELFIKEGSVKVTLQYPNVKGDYNYTLYHVADINKPEKVSIKAEKDGIVFTASNFSPYALVWEPASTGNPGTGDDFNALPIALTAVVSLGAAAGTMVIKKRKEIAE